MVYSQVNCLTCFFPEAARKRAADLDEHFKTTGKVVGPLHGVPIALKVLKTQPVRYHACLKLMYLLSRTLSTYPDMLPREAMLPMQAIEQNENLPWSKSYERLVQCSTRRLQCHRQECCWKR